MYFNVIPESAIMANATASIPDPPNKRFKH